jgi:hypothetical protein
MSMHRDLLAELELTMVPSLKIRPEPGLYVPGSELPKAASRTGSWRRRVWCSLQKQEVEVEFETKAFLGFPRLVGVNRCSAFDEPEDVACGRHCLDSEFRRRWPPALPVADRRAWAARRPN